MRTHLRCVQRVLADGGYVGQPLAHLVTDKLGATGEIAKRNELHTSGVIPGDGS